MARGQRSEHHENRKVHRGRFEEGGGEHTVTIDEYHALNMGANRPATQGPMTDSFGFQPYRGGLPARGVASASGGERTDDKRAAHAAYMKDYREKKAAAPKFNLVEHMKQNPNDYRR